MQLMLEWRVEASTDRTIESRRCHGVSDDFKALPHGEPGQPALRRHNGASVVETCAVRRTYVYHLIFNRPAADLGSMQLY